MSNEVQRIEHSAYLPKRDLRSMLPALAAAVAELPVIGIPFKVPNEAFKELASQRSEAQQTERFNQLFAIGEQTSEDIAALAFLAAGMFIQQTELLGELRRSTALQLGSGELASFAKSTAVVAYRSRIAHDFRYADHRGIDGVTRAAHVTSLELDDIYVLPHLVAERDRLAVRERERDLLRQLTRELDSTPEERARLEEEYAVLTGERWAGAKSGNAGSPLGPALLGTRHGVIIGSPGVGKSTLSRYLARACALGAESVRDRLGWEEAPIPVLIPLALYAEARRNDPALPLRGFLEQRMRGVGGAVLCEAIVEHLDVGELLVVLDGVDEVPESHARAAVVQAVDEFIAAHAANRVVVTSRPFGYIPVRGDIPHFQLPNFSSEQVREFIFKWQRASEAKQHPDAPDYQRAEEDAKALIGELQRNSRVAELATNPLMLVIVSLIRYEKARLPEERVQLYNKAVNTLMDTWNHWRSLPGKDVGGVTLPLDRLVPVWGAIAEWTRRTNNTGIMHRAELKRRLVEVLEQREYDEDDADATAESYLRAAADRAGLIEERGTNIFAFWHPTFEEFLAAVELSTPTSEAVTRLLPLADDPRWREVVLLAVGYVGVVQRDGTTASRIVEALLDPPVGPLETLTCSRLQLAAACIADDVKLPKSTVQRVFVELVGALTRLPYRPLADSFVQAVRAVPRLRPEPRVITALEAMLRNPHWDVRMQTARLLANAAPADPAARAACRLMLHDKDQDVACHAALGLAQVGEYGPRVWTALGRFEDPFARIEVLVREFLRFAPEQALGDLLDFAGSEEADGTQVRRLLHVIAEEENVAQRAAAALAEAPAERVLSATRLLREAGYGGSAFGTPLISVIRVSEGATRAVALVLLATVPPTPELIVELRACAVYVDGELRLRLAAQLAEWQDWHPSVAAGLVPLLCSTDERLAGRATVVLKGFPSSEALHAALVAALGTDEPYNRLRIAGVLWARGYRDDAPARAIVPLLGHEIANVRSQAGRFLRDLPLSGALERELLSHLEAQSPAAQIAAAEFLLQEPRLRVAVARAVAPLVEHESVWIREAALAVLRRLPRSDTLERELLDRLSRAGFRARLAFVEVLHTIGVRGPALSVPLVSQLVDPAQAAAVDSRTTEQAALRLATARLLHQVGYSGPDLGTSLVELAQLDSGVRQQALELIRQLTPSEELAQALVGLMEAEDGYMARYAFELLATMSLPASIEDRLLALLAVPEPTRRSHAAALLKSMPQTATSVVRLLASDDTDVRLDAAGVLTAMGASGVDVAHAMLPLLAHPDEVTRSKAARLLGGAAHPPKEVVSGVLALLDHADPGVRTSAASLLATISSPEVLSEILAARIEGSADGSVEEHVLDLLAHLPSSPTLVRVGQYLLRASDEWTRSRGAFLLVRKGYLGQSACEALVRLMDAADPAIQKAALEQVRSVMGELPQRQGGVGPVSGWVERLRYYLGAEFVPAYPVLARALEALANRAQPNVRLEAVRLLRLYSHPAAPLVPALVPLLTDPNPITRAAAVRQLQSLDAPEALRRGLQPLLFTADSVARLDVARLLRRIGDAGEPLVRALRSLLDEGPEETRIEAASMLRDLGHYEDEIFSRLVPLLASSEPLVRSAAARSLRKLSPLTSRYPHFWSC
ncbi:HEAT repeat domain-containing protein [Longimicrobium sp.]|jgi:HEAT repeat protein|uniref:HEAT repeat domain-containing protein n=1 Tax=Longimicrobium sp. TaxID=2029185 RepID=UPI002F91FFF0